MTHQRGQGKRQLTAAHLQLIDLERVVMEEGLIALAKKTLICKLAAFCKQLAKGTPVGAALRDPPQITAAPTTRKPEC